MGTTAEAVHEAQVRERFDAWSTSATFRHLKPWLAFIQRQVLDRIDWARTTAVLDIACGAGLAVDEAARRLHGRGLACGCDLSEGMLRQRIAARDRGAADVAFAAASAQNLPYRDGSFDAVICTVAFHHFPDPVAALGEMRRVLRSGGQALIVDPCRDLSLSVWVWDRLHRWFEPGHVEYYRTEDLRELFARAGFEAIEVMPLKPSYAAVRKLVRAAGLFVGTAPAANAGRGSSAGAVTPDDTSTAVASGRDPGPAEVGVDPRLLKILVCPLTKGPLRYDRERHELISERAGLAYPIRDGIPVLLAEGHLTP